MCGIAGIVSASTIDPTVWLRQSSILLRHRGPDDEGFYLLEFGGEGRHFGGSETAADARLPNLGGSVGANVALVHRRLSVIDLSSAGHQPMTAPSGTTLVLNGEIYNYRELRSELSREGWRFRSQSDTEVVLAAYEHWGTAAIGRLVGMWALAIVDPVRNVLVLSRDPFGIKPLYIAQTKGALAFSSEVQPLLELSWVDRSPDEVRVADFLVAARADDGRRTFHLGIRQVPAASCAVVPLDLADGMRTTRYWEPRSEPHDMSLPEATDRIRAAFIEAMELHLRSDVPVGACLSGGIDSSAIVCAMREIGGRSLDLHTFSYVSSDPATSEERWINAVNQRVGATAHLVRPDDADFGDDLAELTRTQHEPFGSTSVYAQYRVFAAAAAAGVKVMLDGQGADELLAGYSAFRTAMLRHALRTGAAGAAITLAFGLARTTTSGRNDLARLLGSKTRSLFHPRASKAPAPWYPDLLRPTNRRSAGPGDDLHSQLIESIETSSLPGLLRFEDRNSMAHSVESRVPFLTTGLADLALGLPPDHLVSGTGVTKHVFRLAMRGLVPDEILDRRDKIGFVPTESRWLAQAPLLPLPSAPTSIRRLFVPDLADRISRWSKSGVDTSAAEEAALFRSWAVLEWAERVRIEGLSGSDAANVDSLGRHG